MAEPATCKPCRHDGQALHCVACDQHLPAGAAHFVDGTEVRCEACHRRYSFKTTRAGARAELNNPESDDSWLNLL